MRTVRRQLAACLLFAAGGIIDAYSYCGCDGVLANVQTVNLLLAGMSFAQADWQNVLRYSVPIVAYCLGVAAFLFCPRRCQESKWQFRGIPVFVFKELLVLAPMFFSPAPASFLAYCDAQVRATTQAANSLTFTCESKPEAALTVNVGIVG